MFLMVAGRLLRNFGAATENDLSPYALVLAIGVCKRVFADHLNIQVQPNFRKIGG